MYVCNARCLRQELQENSFAVFKHLKSFPLTVPTSSTLLQVMKRVPLANHLEKLCGHNKTVFYSESAEGALSMLKTLYSVVLEQKLEAF